MTESSGYRRDYTPGPQVTHLSSRHADRVRSANRLSEIVRDRFPAWGAMPHVIRVATVAILRWLTRMDDIEALLGSNAQKHGAAFIDGFFTDLGFSYVVSSCDKAHIPPKGRLVIVANHPLGAMDALAVLRAVLDVRPDVRVVVNELLMDVGGLAGHFLPLDMFTAGPRKSHVLSMGRVLEQDSALLIFPSGDVSHLTPRGLRDRSWFRGAGHLAYKHHAPVLPVFVGGRNSLLFYIVSFFSRTLAMLLLPREIFHQRGRTIHLAIGDPIRPTVFAQPAQIALLRDQVYRLPRRKCIGGIPYNP